MRSGRGKRLRVGETDIPGIAQSRPVCGVTGNRNCMPGRVGARVYMLIARTRAAEPAAARQEASVPGGLPEPA